MKRVDKDEYRALRRSWGVPGTRSSSGRRVPADALSRVREAVDMQYENKSVPTLHTTLTYLTSEGAAGLRAGTYKWSRTTLVSCKHNMRFTFSSGPIHYDVARENPANVAQRSQFLMWIEDYRDAGRTIFYTEETWANKSMSPNLSWNEESSRARLSVHFGQGDRIIIAHVGSRSSGILDGAESVFFGKKKTGDYHGEMCSDIWLIVGSRAHLHLDVIYCISPHLERCTRHRDSSRRALRNICWHLVVIF